MKGNEDTEIPKNEALNIYGCKDTIGLFSTHNYLSTTDEDERTTSNEQIGCIDAFNPLC